MANERKTKQQKRISNKPAKIRSERAPRTQKVKTKERPPPVEHAKSWFKRQKTLPSEVDHTKAMRLWGEHRMACKGCRRGKPCSIGRVLIGIISHRRDVEPKKEAA